MDKKGVKTLQLFLHYSQKFINFKLTCFLAQDLHAAEGLSWELPPVSSPWEPAAPQAPAAGT